MKKVSLRRDFLDELFWIYQEAKDNYLTDMKNEYYQVNNQHQSCKDVCANRELHTSLTELLNKVVRKNYGDPHDICNKDDG